MLNKEVIELLNGQIWLENRASFYYLRLSAEFNNHGYSGISKFFLNQSNEEREHMIKLFEYIKEQDGVPLIPNYNFLEEDEGEFNMLCLFEDSLMGEREVTKSINKILCKCKEVGDYTTENFLQWFVTEQREEENKFKEIIDNLKIIGDNTLGLYEMNKVLGEEKPE